MVERKCFRWTWLVLPLAFLLYGCGTGMTDNDGTLGAAENGRAAVPAVQDERPEHHPVDETNEESERHEVRQLTESFGQKMKLVSILAPIDEVQKSITEHYGELVDDELLKQWLENPVQAPGRTVSSPWPDRIDISDITKTADGTYEVTGHIIEVTSDQPDEAARVPITLTVQRSANGWRITDVRIGEDQAADNTAYTNERFGFRFTLPESWQGYSIVEEQWEGRALEGNRAGEITERGPLLLIRHPEWTPRHLRQDIPMMIFTHTQWEALQQGRLQVSAAPVPPTELGRNNRYIFALPARYNFAFPEGWEEVEQILQGQPLTAVNGL